jgi:PhnB protein
MSNPIPDGYHSVTPYLAVSDAAQAIDWYKRALGAEEVMRYDDKGKIVHAEIRVGDSIIMLADEWAEGGHLSPQTQGGTTVSLMLYVADVNRTFEQAVEAGAKAERPVQDQFYGDRTGTLLDPFGHRWHVATHVEDVDAEEMERRMTAANPGTPQPQSA